MQDPPRCGLTGTLGPPCTQPLLWLLSSGPIREQADEAFCGASLDSHFHLPPSVVQEASHLWPPQAGQLSHLTQHPGDPQQLLNDCLPDTAGPGLSPTGAPILLAAPALRRTGQLAIHMGLAVLQVLAIQAVTAVACRAGADAVPVQPANLCRSRMLSEVWQQ